MTNRHRPLLFTLLFLVLFCRNTFASPVSLQDWIGEYCPQCAPKLGEMSGAYILEKGEEALMARAWLTANAQNTIDVQYFIWSTDNIGILAGESLLAAAERGVKVRVLVDDLLVDTEDETLIALDAHPNVQIRIYNPQHSVGIAPWRRVLNLTFDFRSANQRMHDKTAIFDNLIGITGGRNMADEYFDFNQEYTFRDRDVLLIGKVVNAMTSNFNEFWNSPHAKSIGALLGPETGAYSEIKIKAHYAALHAYARDPANYAPEVRESISSLQESFSGLAREIIWSDIIFLSDIPGKNSGQAGLAGGGEITRELVRLLEAAEESVTIQSPYLVMEDEWVDFFGRLTGRGVRIRIITNSLLSTDNMLAYSGYHKKRSRLLDAGIEIYEYMPHPASQVELMGRRPESPEKAPVFAIHAKSMVVDGKYAYIGTFNLDPRSANLNTEVGVLIKNAELSRKLSMSIERDMHPDNSWRITPESNPDYKSPWLKRTKLFFLELLPLTQVL